MLKALELIGFKSFADKTRFEFPRGITVVVGPNGSGKSNVVDAIKWVLGEQSVKSLRGKEMADVIFNGSGARRGMNCAEATLTFDNVEGKLPVDTPEVHVSRRVYRSGEGEYLINGQPCRLRDIRDMFAGTGVSTQAYSIIEQGKVDVLLQSSPRDRRLIFEEAAGISRFKAKKTESIRRLDRVEQNLLRLSDIVDEVEGRLRQVRNQATKARRYREYSDRLQELRTQVGLTDWRRLTAELDQFEAKLTEFREEIARLNSEAEATEVRILELENESGSIEDEVRECEANIAKHGERIATCESTIEHERRRTVDLAEEIERHRGQIEATTSRADDLNSQVEETSQAVDTAEGEHGEIAVRVADNERELTEVTERFDRVRDEIDGRRGAHTEMLRQIGQLGNQISVLESQVKTATETRERCLKKTAQLEQELVQTDVNLSRDRQEEAKHATSLAACDAKWELTKERLDDQQTKRDSLQDELAHLRARLTGARERSAVLEDLEKRQEGVSSGVKQLLLSARETPDGPLHKIRGLVADILQVKVETAPLIEVALSEKAGYLVMGPDSGLGDWLSNGETHSFAGRVGFIQMEAGVSANQVSAADLEGKPGVLGRADRFVSSQPEYAQLTEHLLGQTWIVEKLTHALALAESLAAESESFANANFVTLAGDWLSADGTLCVGPRTASAGLISRRSELRALAVRMEELESEIQQQQASVEEVTAQLAQLQTLIRELEGQRKKLERTVGDHRMRIRATEERQTLVQEQQVALAGELRSAEQELVSAGESLTGSQSSQLELEASLTELESQIESDAEQIDELERRRSTFGHEATSYKVELAKSEEQLGHLRVRMLQFKEDQQERQQAVDESRRQLEQATEKQSESQRHILQAEAEVAELYLQKEALAKETIVLVNRREEYREHRSEMSTAIQKMRNEARKLESEAHTQDLAAGEVRHARETLAERLREDYEIELGELEHEPTAEEQQQREAVEEEISGIRRKLNNIGSVNLEALEELDGLEERFGDLSTQLEDLQSAKKSLEEIIERINEDSRRLFIETLETVRGHFQDLFRKLFGGGSADIIIEDEIDILESGLEIVARPPGKEPRSISLLSGGEKTMTCVALLLAIFRSKPSPFCVLDEVDAALDEANIERFIGVVKDFLTCTQFIVISHSKKTMTCAGTLYGVTMQESGISKRVSVQFDDVTETGEILESALERDRIENGDSKTSGDNEEEAA